MLTAPRRSLGSCGYVADTAITLAARTGTGRAMNTVAGINENLAILLLAAKFGVPVCPHAGGVGLCEMVQHLAMFDYVAVSAGMTDSVLEYVDHLHEPFTDPVRIMHGRYLAPSAPGFSATLRPESLRRYHYPGGSEWTATWDSADARAVGRRR